MQATGHVNCCGYMHITVGVGMSDTEDELQKLIGIVQGQTEQPGAHGNTVYEIILNDSQCGSRPKLLKLMEALGFVYVCRMNNGRHDSWINIFHRSQRNGKAYKKPSFKWNGLSVVEEVANHQVKPLTFKKAEVPNPFTTAKGEFDTAQLQAVLRQS